MIARLSKLRQLMKTKGIDAYIILSGDPHQSEYLPEHWNRIPFISGFTGTYGNITITADQAMVWTDGKEAIKAKIELANSPYKYHVKELVSSDLDYEMNWILNNVKKGSSVGIDPANLNITQMKSLNDFIKLKGLNLIYTTPNLVDSIWNNRPSIPASPITFRSKKYEPINYSNKIKNIQTILKELNVDLHVISNLESIARLLNVRANDITHNPLVISYLVVGKNSVSWFINKKRIKNAKEEFKNINIIDYEEFPEHLKKLTKEQRVLIDPNETTQFVLNNLHESSNIIMGNSPLNSLKAIKTKAELTNMVNANIKDSLAVVETIYWVKNNVGKKTITEWDVSQKTLEYRKQKEGFVDLAFSSIVSYEKNGANIHYYPKKETALKIKNKGILLIDSGAHYLDGTSDITRTITVGKATQEMKNMYTNVLKGHLALARIKFPKGTKGYQLDVLARQFIWNSGHTYYHGTGHGIGYCTCVHETSGVGVSPLKNIVLDAGMTLTNEPGYYKDPEYGIRIENCVYISENKKLSRINGKNPVFEFIDLTLCPYERELINKNLLTEEEIEQINKYHKLVNQTLKTKIKDKKILLWLKKACEAI